MAERIDKKVVASFLTNPGWFLPADIQVKVPQKIPCSLWGSMPEKLMVVSANMNNFGSANGRNSLRNTE